MKEKKDLQTSCLQVFFCAQRCETAEKREKRWRSFVDFSKVLRYDRLTVIDTYLI